MVEQQRQAYKVEGVDEEAPAIDPRKRKADGDEVCSSSPAAQVVQEVS